MAVRQKCCQHLIWLEVNFFISCHAPQNQVASNMVLAKHHMETNYNSKNIKIGLLNIGSSNIISCDKNIQIGCYHTIYTNRMQSYNVTSNSSDEMDYSSVLVFTTASTADKLDCFLHID